MNMMASYPHDAPIETMKLEKFSFATSSVNSKDVIWEHCTRSNELNLNLHKSGFSNQRLVMRVVAGNDLLEETDLTQLATAIREWEKRPQQRLAHAAEKRPVAVMVQCPLLALKYPLLQTRQQRRVQFKFFTSHDFRTMQDTLQDMGFSIENSSKSRSASTSVSAAATTLAVPSQHNFASQLLPSADPYSGSSSYVAAPRHDLQHATRPSSTGHHQREYGFQRPQPSATYMMPRPASNPNISTTMFRRSETNTPATLRSDSAQSFRLGTPHNGLPSYELARQALSPIDEDAYPDQQNKLTNSQHDYTLDRHGRVESLATLGQQQTRLGTRYDLSPHAGFSAHSQLFSNGTENRCQSELPYQDIDARISSHDSWAQETNMARVGQSHLTSATSLPLPSAPLIDDLDIHAYMPPKRPPPSQKVQRTTPKIASAKNPSPEPDASMLVVPPEVGKTLKAASTSQPRRSKNSATVRGNGKIAKTRDDGDQDAIGETDDEMQPPDTTTAQVNPAKATSAQQKSRAGKNVQRSKTTSGLPGSTATSAPVPAKRGPVEEAIRAEVSKKVKMTSTGTQTTSGAAQTSSRDNTDGQVSLTDRIEAAIGTYSQRPMVELHDRPEFQDASEEDRDRLVQDFIAARLEDPTFLELCRSIDRTWRRTVFGL